MSTSMCRTTSSRPRQRSQHRTTWGGSSGGRRRDATATTRRPVVGERAVAVVSPEKEVRVGVAAMPSCRYPPPSLQGTKAVVLPRERGDARLRDERVFGRNPRRTVPTRRDGRSWRIRARNTLTRLPQSNEAGAKLQDSLRFLDETRHAPRARRPLARTGLVI